LEENSAEGVVHLIAIAVTDIAKSLKAIQFYPDGHPSLTAILQETVCSIGNIPAKEEGIELDVSRQTLSFEGSAIPEKHGAISDFRNALFLRRTEKVIFLPELGEEDLTQFLTALTIEPSEVVEKGGLEKILISQKVSKIWINRVDYERLTEELKKEQEKGEEFEGEFILADEDISRDLTELIPEREEEESFDTLISLLKDTGDPERYRALVTKISASVLDSGDDVRISHLEEAVTLYSHHMDNPPGEGEDIVPIAVLGIREISNEGALSLYFNKIRSTSLKEQRVGINALLAIGDGGVERILSVLCEEGDLGVRKILVETVVGIGEGAIPEIIPYLKDDRWYVVRNMVTILGKLGNEEVAPDLVTALQNPDPRVKKESIKALSRIPGTLSIAAIGECCFDQDESIKTIAITALGSRKEEEAVEILRERFIMKNLLFPDTRLVREVIESLRNIGSESSVDLLRTIALYNPFMVPKKIKDMKVHAVKALGKIKSSRAKEVLEELSKNSDTVCRNVASKQLKRTVHGKEGT